MRSLQKQKVIGSIPVCLSLSEPPECCWAMHKRNLYGAFARMDSKAWATAVIHCQWRAAFGPDTYRVETSVVTIIT